MARRSDPRRRPEHPRRGRNPWWWTQGAALLGPLALVALLAAGPVVGASAATAATAATTPSTAALPAATSPTATSAPPVLVRAPSGPSLTLVSQSTWVGPGQTFSLELRLGASAPPSSSLGLTLAVYGCLSSVSAFDQALTNQGPTSAPVARSTSVLPWSSLPSAPGGSPGTIALALPVVAPGVPTSTTAPAGNAAPVAPFTIVLRSSGCQAYPDGVYPLRLSLVDTTTGSTVSTLTTDVVYLGTTTGTQRLRVATVVPLAVAQHASGASTSAVRQDPLAALARLSTSQVDAIKGAVTALGHHPSVATTVALTGQTAQAVLDHGAPTLVASLRQVLATSSHEVPGATYAPLDVPSLVSSGLSGELGAQVSSGRQAVAGLAPTSSLGASTTFVGSDPLDSSALDALAAVGYTQVVVPGNDVVAPAASRSRPAGSTTTAFTVSTGRASPVTVLPADADLTSRFAGDPGNPVLAAHQLLAELAQVYFEAPNDVTPRGVVALPPPGWLPRGTFLDSLLGGLASDPVVDPVTVSGLLAAVPSPEPCPSCRLDATGPGGPPLPAASIHKARQRLSSFASALANSGPSAGRLVQHLSDLLLSSEASGLRGYEQDKLVAAANGALDAQLATLAVSGDQSLTLTARKARIPVTIDSAATYPISAVLTLSSDKLIFTNGQTRFSQPVDLDHSTNVVYVDVRTRVSGEFKVAVEVRSPTGGLVLTDGVLSVRSTATSVVGILLTLGAIAVLAGWWIRTSRHKRAARRQARDDEVTT
ncbi:MAG: DUF6049 family protein [Acidimicrobiales bacterium]